MGPIAVPGTVGNTGAGRLLLAWVFCAHLGITGQPLTAGGWGAHGA